MAGRITSACCAVSVMNCSSTTVKRSSRREALEHALLVGRDRGGVRAPADERLHRRVHRRVGECLAQPGHVDRPHRSRAEVLALEQDVADRPGRGCRDVGEAAAAIPPGAGEERQRGDRGVRGRRAGVALGAHAEPEQRGPRGGELATHAGDRLGVDPALRRALLDGGAAELRRAARRSRRCAPGTTRRRGGRRRRSRASSRWRGRRRCPAAGGGARRRAGPCGCGTGSTTTSRAPWLRASSSLRQRCGAVDSGFQPQISR